MASSGSVPGKGRIRAIVEKLSRVVPKKGRIFVSTKIWKNPGQYSEKVESVRVSKNCPEEYRKGSNLCEYQKMEESGSVPGKGRIPTSVEKLSPRVPEKGRLCVRIEKWHNPGQNRQKVESVRVSKNCPGEYRKRVDSV